MVWRTRKPHAHTYNTMPFRFSYCVWISNCRSRMDGFLLACWLAVRRLATTTYLVLVGKKNLPRFLAIRIEKEADGSTVRTLWLYLLGSALLRLSVCQNSVHLLVPPVLSDAPTAPNHPSLPSPPRSFRAVGHVHLLYWEDRFHGNRYSFVIIVRYCAKEPTFLSLSMSWSMCNSFHIDIDRHCSLRVAL